MLGLKMALGIFLKDM